MLFIALGVLSAFHYSYWHIKRQYTHFFHLHLTDIPCLTATSGMLEEQIFALKKASESRLESLKKEAVAVSASRPAPLLTPFRDRKANSCLTACVVPIISSE